MKKSQRTLLVLACIGGLSLISLTAYAYGCSVLKQVACTKTGDSCTFETHQGTISSPKSMDQCTSGKPGNQECDKADFECSYTCHWEDASNPPVGHDESAKYTVHDAGSIPTESPTCN